MTTQTTMPPESSTAEPRQGESREPGRGKAPIGPGTQLRQARLDLKLAPEDVANILHLSARQIVTLENDDYANLPGPTYVRGYLRGYAQLLGLSPEPIVDAYNRLVAARKPVDLGKLAPKPEIRSDHQLVKFATVGVVALILGLSAVWWQEQDQDEPTPAITSDSVPAPTEPEPAVAMDPPPVDFVTRSEPVITPVPPINGQGVMAEPVQVAPEKKPAQTAVVPPAPVPVEAPIVAPPEPPAPTPTITGPRGRLVVQTTLDSWADVRDANGNRLLYELVPADRTVVVEGVAPLAVFLGNAEGVSIEFNGEAYDISRHRRGDIARFTLGASSQPRVE